MVVAQNIRSTSSRKSRRDLDTLQRRPLPKSLTFGRLQVFEIDQIYQLAVANIGGTLASRETFHRVLTIRPDLTFIIRHKDDRSVRAFSAFLLLSAAGQRAAAEDRFNGTNPAPYHLASDGINGAALYCWASVAKRLAGFVIPHIMAALQEREFAHLNIYSRSGTNGGKSLMHNLGYEPVLAGSGDAIGDLMVYRRLINTSQSEAA